MKNAFLPGTPGERICDLRRSARMNQTELAERLGISKSTLSRIESGETSTVNSDMVIKLSEIFGVSTDFILGMTDCPVNAGSMNPGLSEKAVKVLADEKTDKRALDSMLTAGSFPAVSKCIANYLDGTMEKGIAMHNDIVGMAMKMLSGYGEAQNETAAIKIPPNEERRQLMALIQNMLGEMKKAQVPSEVTEADRETVNRIFREANARLKKKKPLSAETIADIVLKNVSKTCNIDGSMLEGFRAPIAGLMRNMGGSGND